MSEIRLNPTASVTSPGRAAPRQQAYSDLEASLLLCPRCGKAMPVRKRLLLILPEGEKYEYLCVQCSATCGTKVEPPRAPASPFISAGFL